MIRKKSKFGSLYFTILTVLMLFTSVISVIADGSPTFPHNFYGTLTINSVDAQPNTDMKAYIDGEERTFEPYATDTVGEYGSNTFGGTKFQVDGTSEDFGLPIVIMIETSPNSNNFATADQTPTFNPGGNTNLDLTVTEVVCDTEVCDGLDNDCDGQIDEDFTDLGDACSAGQGECEASGERVCTQDGTGTECNAVPGTPEAELCNDLDDDCDGTIDNGFNLGDACFAGVGACAVAGNLVCTQDETGTECDATPGTPSAEICDNDIDDDCDGLTDEEDTEDCECVIDDNCDDTNDCTDDVCNAGVCEYTNNNDPCDDGLFCTDGDQCADGACVAGPARDCSGNDIDEIDTCTNIPDNNPFTWDYRDAFTSVCDEQNDLCTLGDASIDHTCSDNCGAACEIDDDCPTGSVCLADCTCSIVENFCIEITGMSLFDSDGTTPITQVTPGQMYFIEVINTNVCDGPVESMQVVQILGPGSTPLNIAAVTSTIPALDSNIINVGFVMDGSAAPGSYNAEAFNWNGWASQPGWEALSLSDSLAFDVGPI